MSSSSGTPLSYRPQVNRAITKRWAEAKQISYEGNDWGDDDDSDYYQPTPSSTRAGQQSSWPGQTASAQRYYAQPPEQARAQANRNFTNPSPTRSNGRPSFDRGDERRTFSAHAPSSSLEGPYPPAGQNPIPETLHDPQQAHQAPSGTTLHGPPPLHIYTGGRPQSRDRTPSREQAQHSRLPSTSYQDTAGGGSLYGDGGRRSESSGRPSLSDLQGRSESPYRAMNPPLSARSQHNRDDSPAKRFPPRKSSLSQDNPILEPSLQPGPSASAIGGPPTAESPKPLPFIRPADIYKRMEEEREKERRSQESSRPSIDSNASRPRERDIFASARRSRESSRPKIDTASGPATDNRSPARAPPGSLQTSEQLLAENKALVGPEETDTTRKPKSTLDPVAERKSEYGFETLLKEAGPDHPSGFPPAASTPAERSTPISARPTHSEQGEPLTAVSASSNYSERPGPVTASSHGSAKSLPHSLPVVRGVSDFGTDVLNPNAATNDDIPATQRSATKPQNYQSKPPAPSAAPRSSEREVPDVVTTRAAAADPTETEIRQNPSMGLHSVAHENFNDSQEQVPQSPLSTDESVVRSNSSSASEISPIMSRGTGSFPANGDVHQSRGQHPSIAQAMDELHTGPLLSAPAQPPISQDMARTISEPELTPPPPPPPAKDGYRRDYSIPNPGNSQARTPLIVKGVGVTGREHALESSATLTDIQDPQRIPPPVPQVLQARDGQSKSPATKPQFEGPPLPSLPATTPTIGGASTKGAVRELAEKLESRSGRTSPALSLDREANVPRPLPGRLESFRPSLPGGWQSYSTMGDAQSQQPEQSATAHNMEYASRPAPPLRDGAVGSPVSSEDDDIPTAGPPKPTSARSEHEPSRTAFAAAAAAGSAIVGAFTAATGADTQRNEAQRPDEVNKYETMTTDSVTRNHVSTRDPGDGVSKGQASTVVPHVEEEPRAPSPIAPSPPAKDTPSGSDTPGSTRGYFPPPLRTGRAAEPVPSVITESSTPPRPPMLPTFSSDTTTQDTESDRLHKEIVRSLTPKSPRDAGLPARTLDDGSSVPQLSAAHEPQYSARDRVTVPEVKDDNTGQLSVDSDPTEWGQSQTWTAPMIADKVLPQPQDFGLDERPMLEQRFSWERQPETESPKPSQTPESVLVRPPGSPQGARGQTGTPETIRPQAQPTTPSTINSSRLGPSIAPANTLRHVQDDAPNRSEESGNSADMATPDLSAGLSLGPNQSGLPATNADTLLHSSAREMPFRDILSLNTPPDRIQAFNTNRRLVAGQETGLVEWLKAMGNQLPEHSDILHSNGQLSTQENDILASHRPSPARLKFPRLAALANNPQATDPEYDPSISNSPSTIKSSNLHRPGQGKKLLKDAGKIGGQAGVVAKGLFAKGKNKLRAGAGSGDKGILAGRRRSSQPTIVIDEPQHSSGITNAAPQIPNLNISPIESEEHWYNPIDAAVAATTLAQERSVSPLDPIQGQESDHHDLLLASRLDKPLQQPRQSSPRVSAVGSFQDGEVPSRSVSEVTRPTNSVDERSPVAAIPEDFRHSEVSDSVAPDGSKQSRLLTAVPFLGPGIASIRLPSAPVSDALGPLPNLQKPADAGVSTLPPESTVLEQNLSPDRDVTPQVEHQVGAFGPSSNVLLTVPSDIPPNVLSKGVIHLAQPADPAVPATALAPSSEDAPRSDAVDANVLNRASQPSLDGATPPYTEPDLSKAAEAALYRSQAHLSEDTTDDLPAYQSTRDSVQNKPKPRVGKGDVIVPVADLSHQRPVGSGPAQSRPFSFVAGDTLISRGSMPVERAATVPDAPPIQPELAKEASVAGSDDSRDSFDQAKRKSRSYSRPFVTDSDAKDHLAYRQAHDNAHSKENFGQSNHREDFQAVEGRPSQTRNDDDGQYRIPGPYVQEYRSPKQPPQVTAARQLPPPRPISHGPPAQRPGHGIDPLRSHDPYHENQIRPQGQPANQSMVPMSGQVASPVSERPHQLSKVRLFRKRSKSRSVRSRNEEPQDVESKPEKPGVLRKQRTKGDDSSIRSQLGSTRRSSGDGINRQMSHGGTDHDAVNGERGDQVGDLRNSTAGNQLQNDVRKKRFSGFGSLFGRSSAGATKTSTKAQGSQPVQRASTLSHIFLGKPDARPRPAPAAPDSMYAQNHQRHQKSPRADQSGSYAQPQHGYQSINPPIGGYYAPDQQQQQLGSPTMPHDPDSFSRPRFSAEQQPRPDRYANQHNQGGYQVPYQQGSRPFGQHLPSQTSQPEDPRRPLQINTNQPGTHSSMIHHFVTAPPVLPPQFPLLSQSSTEPHQVSYYSNQQPSQEGLSESRPRSRSPYAYAATQGPNPNIASHVVDLHKRSRSPRNGRRLSDDERLEEVERSDPANQLGTFSNIAAPRSGGADSSEQEAPWRIRLPSTDDEENTRKSQATLLEREREGAQQGKTKAGEEKATRTDNQKEETDNYYPRKSEEEWRKEEQAQHEPTIAEKVMGVQLPRAPLPLQRSTSTGNTMAKLPKMSPVELPGSKAPGDDSDEEIVMSSTAYPGQEWAPENWGYGGNWDD